MQKFGKDVAVDIKEIQLGFGEFRAELARDNESFKKSVQEAIQA